jgi:hypothetical protein
MRQLQREENPDINEIIRRYRADEEDFSDIEFAYTVLSNESKEDMDRATAHILTKLQLDRDI